MDTAVVATAFAATLAACWAFLAHAPSLPPQRHQERKRPEVFLAAMTIGACAALAAYWLDLVFRPEEGHTIASYATQPLAVAATTYNDPNNHVLHTLLVWVVHQFGGLNRIVLRLPAFLAFCLFLPLLWWFTRREYGATAAAFATVLAGTSPFLVNYATNARGYTLMLLFFATALLCGQRLVQAPKRTALWVAWAAALALGLYTVPLMAYPAATTGAWMLLVRWRRCGRDGFGPFLARTAAWSAVALALAFALYLPVFVAEGVADPRETFARCCASTALPPLAIVEHPPVLWHQWLPIPAWARGMLLALVAVGASARGSSCGRRGTLPLAAVLAWGLLFAAHPVLLAARMAIWALIVLLILAGTGTAIVFESALARAAHWRTVSAPVSDSNNRWQRGNRLFLLRCASTALLFCALSRWTVSGMNEWMPLDTRIRQAVPELQMRPGDHFSSCRNLGLTRMGVQQHHAVEKDVSSRLFEWPTRRASVYRLSLGVDHARDAEPSPLDAAPSQGRVFLFDYYRPVPGDTISLCSSYPMVPEELGTEWLHDREQVAAFREGRVHLLNDWTQSRGPVEDGPSRAPPSEPLQEELRGEAVQPRRQHDE